MYMQNTKNTVFKEICLRRKQPYKMFLAYGSVQPQNAPYFYSSEAMYVPFSCNTPPTCNHHLQLRLCWAITMHKSQGQTLDKAVIDLGPKESCTGLTFVCLCRAKRLMDLMVEPMSLDRIGNLGNSSTMKARLQEEVRLVELAQSTRVRYTDMGVFSAVAGTQ